MKKQKIILITICFLLIPSFHSAADENYFDRTVEGSTGWNAVEMNLMSEASASSAEVAWLLAGTAFRIAEEDGDWWRVVLADNTEGYVQHDYCMINLPDVLPTIEYDITNSYAAIYQSSGYTIDGVTGEKLYDAGDLDGKEWNEKLGRYEYLVPVMYSTAKKIAIAQFNAYTLTDGRYTLKIYDAYRPHSVSVYIAEKFSELYYSNLVVQENVDSCTQPDGNMYEWGIRWFLAQSVSTHNTGAAIDVTLCEYEAENEAENEIGYEAENEAENEVGYEAEYDAVSSEYVELSMQTAMHELSTDAIKYYSGSVEKAPENYADTMNDNAILLDHIFSGGDYGEYSFISTGMTSLASEWWHFQDNDTHRRVKEFASSGMDFQVEDCLSNGR
ncbi:MAG: SH3 domain-containing protein [Lachnospiraceae bacterium]|nr:SH3 domain-containing protein [Lachnospiraceae bacterium]